MQVNLKDIAAERHAARQIPAGVPLNSDEASRLVTLLGRPLRPSTLKKMRCLGGGPPFRKSGKIAVYMSHELKQWVEAGMQPS